MSRLKAFSNSLLTLQTELTQLRSSLLSPSPTCSKALFQLAQQTPTRLTLPAWHALQLKIASWHLSLGTRRIEFRQRKPRASSPRRHTSPEFEPEPEPAPAPKPSTAGIQRPVLLPFTTRSLKQASRYRGLDSEAQERAPPLDTALAEQYPLTR